MPATLQLVKFTFTDHAGASDHVNLTMQVRGAARSTKENFVMNPVEIEPTLLI